MDGESGLGEILIQENLMTEHQLKTALDFQTTLGGDLRSIVVKLGYVKDSVLAGLVAKEEHVAASYEITYDVIDFDALKTLPKDVLEKHQVIPLASEGSHLVLAMADPNDLRAMEEIQFLANRTVEPAVATKQAIRKAINQLHELKRQFETAKREGRLQKTAALPVRRSVPGDVVTTLQGLPVDKLIRGYLLLKIQNGELSADELFACANTF